ncbi:ferrous iron transport protein A [bacterium SCSIO 12643]|nr:ferrous iron transport protein A [bacterium SCSIO 12643]
MKNTNINKRRATDLKIGESSVIDSFENEEFSSQFLEIGCLPNAPVELVRKGPAGQTLYLRVNGHAYAFRKEEASHIILKF